MDEDVRDLDEALHGWLWKSQTVADKGGGHFKLHTPFVDMFGNQIVLVGRTDGAEVRISDNAQTMRHLEVVGRFDKEKYRMDFSNLLSYFGAYYDKDDKTISMWCEAKDFPKAVVRLVQVVIGLYLIDC